ncbi:hypothetical protein MATL_G00177340 [Megalops atlanticus]|uniref:Uncharacterized protein n=1 Tax=Megalops atlanticus TaxID=7932 RepID=A0A9D3SZP5_MEGAT|nr:hypothetical protein MATL_G00177340 [Megalops atlanticus]
MYQLIPQSHSLLQEKYFGGNAQLLCTPWVFCVFFKFVLICGYLDTMTTLTAENGSTGHCYSCSSFGSLPKKEGAQAASSQPFIKPNLSLNQIKHFAEKLVMKILPQKPQSASRSAVEEPQSLDESKRIIKDLAFQLDRVSQHKSRAVLLRVAEDSCSLQECQHFILQWAEELRHLPQRQHLHSELTQTDQMHEGECSSQTSSEYGRPDLQQQTPDHCSPAQDQKLKKAQLILDQWAQNLLSLPKSSVCPGEDVSAVLQKLEKQWKKGQLPNMLPVLEFIMWSLIQDQFKEGSVPQLWLRSKQRFESGATSRRIPRSVWKWIQKPAADIRLDPKTANPDLILSSDRRRVKMATIIESVHNPRDGYYRTTHKVGVYLDIEEGQLSFYDVKRRCHIYTFNDSFSEKVYPVFGTTETDKEIIIKDFKNSCGTPFKEMDCG